MIIDIFLNYIFVGDPEKSSDSMISVIRDSMFNVI